MTVRRIGQPGVLVNAASLLLSLGATVLLLRVPFYTGVGVSAVAIPDPEGGATYSTPSVVETRHATLVDVNGARVLVVLAIPNALALVALAGSAMNYGRGVPAVVASLFVGFCVLTGFSIGPFYVPSAIVAVAAALVARRPVAVSR